MIWVAQQCLHHLSTLVYNHNSLAPSIMAITIIIQVWHKQINWAWTKANQVNWRCHSRHIKLWEIAKNTQHWQVLAQINHNLQLQKWILMLRVVSIKVMFLSQITKVLKNSIIKENGLQIKRYLYLQQVQMKWNKVQWQTLNVT